MLKKSSVDTEQSRADRHMKRNGDIVTLISPRMKNRKIFVTKPGVRISTSPQGLKELEVLED